MLCAHTHTHTHARTHTHMHTHTHTHTQSKVTALCNEKSDWLQYNVDSPLTKILEQKRDFEERIQPYMAKLAPPPGQ